MNLFISLGPIFFLSRVLGLTPLKFEKQKAVESRGHVYYSFLLLGAGLVILVKELIKKGSIEIARIQEPLWSVTVVVKLITYIICSFLVTTTAVFKVSKMAAALNSMNVLYKSMRIVDYESLTLFVLKLLFANMIMFFACFFQSFVGFYKASLLQMFQVVFQYVFFLLINLLTSHFCVFAYLLRLSYATMNDILTRGCKSGGEAIEEIRRIREYDWEVKSIYEGVDTIYMPVILVYVFWLFTNKIHGFMWITHEEFSWVSLVLYTICFDGEVVYVLNICSSCYDEAEKTANYLHELFIDNDDPELKEEIEIFSLQLLHRKVEFNACGFFKLDFSLLYSMVGAVTTYIIILMQFQGNNPGGNGNCTAVKCPNCTLVS